MNYCSRCVLPETFPGISFDDQGVCSYCKKAHPIDSDQKDVVKRKFEELADQIRGKNSYDVILAYSGGKDSTFTLHLLTQVYGLKVLAWTFDNGFISEQSKKNIIKITDKMGATSIFFRPPLHVLKKAFRHVAENNIYSPKSMDRASSICTTCIGIVKSMILKTALYQRIPLAAFGWSPGQAPLTSAIMQTNPRLQRITNSTVRDPLLKDITELKEYFLTDEDLQIDKSIWPINVHPLAFTDYDEGGILKHIESLGWIKPDDTDANSSNCTLNALANYLHLKNYKFHPYAWEIAGIVRSGQMDRGEGIEKISSDEDTNMVNYAADILEIKI